MIREKILLIGASGFTGQRVLQKLIAQGADVTCFLRKSSIKPTIESGHYKVAYGNLDDMES
ncbi:MAG: NAD(P)H-binding protein, partial [Pseudomonadota bacterium]|nr:NAD(P)H-binding protein [Pseudomonadota bacterium]